MPFLRGLPVLGLVTDGEFPAALCASADNDLPSVLCGHAGTESVLVAPLAAAGLKCTFHVCFVSLVEVLTELQS